MASLPPELQPQAQQLLGSGASLNVNPNDLTGVGQSFGAAVAAVVPALQPFIPNLDAAFHQAMSLSIADTFAHRDRDAGLAFVAALFMRELPLRRTNAEAAAVPAAAGTEDAPRPDAPQIAGHRLTTHPPLLLRRPWSGTAARGRRVFGLGSAR